MKDFLLYQSLFESTRINKDEILCAMFDNPHRTSLPNYYQIRKPSRSTILSIWRALNPNTHVFYVTVSDQLINQSYSKYD